MSSDLRDAMISHEQSQLRTKLSSARKEFDDLDILVSGAIIQIRQLIDLYEKDVTKLNVDEASQTMERLKENVHRMRELHGQIESLKKALNEK
ncbi:MAG TPA: hypothetical protein PLE24_02515 [Chitinispirillaceae bacterium]|jgi:DNA repair exonuclease SbcCD ATPase subunit|nr:hypothetical protein [Chitinispirillaceae bacterium]